MAETPIGEFEQLVMLALVRVGEDAYGVPIHEELAARARRTVSLAAVYKTLERLEAKGYVESEQEPQAPGAIGLPRRIYRPTGLGERVLRAWTALARELAWEAGS